MKRLGNLWRPRIASVAGLPHQKRLAKLAKRNLNQLRFQLAAPNIENANAGAQTKKQEVLMKAEGSIWNHKTQKYEKALFFFYTGAQKAVI